MTSEKPIAAIYPRHREVLELYNQGFSINAIGNRLNYPAKTVTRILSTVLGVKRHTQPPSGYLGLDAAAKRFGLRKEDLRYGINSGRLQCVSHARRLYVKLEDVQVWLNDSKERRFAREAMRKVLALPPKRPG